MDHRLILNNAGFTMHHVCSCTGSREERYRNMNNRKVEYIIYPTKKQMATKILVNNQMRVVCRTGIENLESEIDKYKV